MNRPVTALLDDGARKYVNAGELAYTVARPFGDVRVVHADGLGSVRALTMGAGTTSQTYRTDEFGAPMLTEGTDPQPFPIHRRTA